MSEIANKKRLLSIGFRVKTAREEMGLTQEQFADKYDYARTTLAKLEAGLRDFKSTEIATLAKQLNVSCDYLLGRTTAKAPDDFIQEAVRRYGLSEEALAGLERLAAPLDIDEAEKERVTAKMRAHTGILDVTERNVVAQDEITGLRIRLGLFDESTKEGRKLSENPPPTMGELLELAEMYDDSLRKQALATLDAMLTTPTKRENSPDGETYALTVLNGIWGCRYREYSPLKQPIKDSSGQIMTRTIDADKQRLLELQFLNDTVLAFCKEPTDAPQTVGRVCKGKGR